MGALRLTLRAELRRRWRPMLMLALLLGITGRRGADRRRRGGTH